MSRGRNYTGGGAAPAPRHADRRRIAHITLCSGLMLMATGPRKLEWVFYKTKWVRLFILLLQHLPWPSLLTIFGNEFYAIHRWHIFIRGKGEESRSDSKPADWRSETRIQKLTREGTWNRLKGYITILYALCTHSILWGKHRLLYRYIDFLCFV